MSTPAEIAAAAIAAAPATVSPVEVLDNSLEATELRDAEAAVLAEADAEKARAAGTTTAALVEEPTAPAATAAATQPEPMVPISALHKERKVRQALERENARLEGAAGAFKSVAEGRTTAPLAPAEPTKTPDELLAEIAKKRLDAADNFDQNKITGKAWEEEKMRLEAEERDIRDKSRPTVVTSTATQDDLAMERHATELVEKHPILRVVTEAQLAPLTEVAYAQAKAKGENVPTGAMETVWLRERVAKLAELTYPEMAEQAKGVVTTTAQVVTSTAAPALSPTAAARDAKLQLAANHPVDVSKLGSPAGNVGLSDTEFEARLNSATEDEAIALLDSNPAMKAKLFKGAVA